YKVLYDFSAKFGSGVYLTQMTMSTSGDVFSFHTVNSSTGKAQNAVVFVRSTGKIYVMPPVSGEVLDENKIDKDGVYMIANFKSDNLALYNYAAGTVKIFKKGDPTANGSGHFDLGATWTANSDGFHTGLVIRDLSSPWTLHNIVKYKTASGSLNWSICDHVSVREHIESFVVGSTYCGSGNWYAFESEI